MMSHTHVFYIIMWAYACVFVCACVCRLVYRHACMHAYTTGMCACMRMRASLIKRIGRQPTAIAAARRLRCPARRLRTLASVSNVS